MILLLLVRGGCGGREAAAVPSADSSWLEDGEAGADVAKASVFVYPSIDDPLELFPQLPRSVDLRESDLVVAAVKDQLSCGACPFFAASVCFEAALLNSLQVSPGAVPEDWRRLTPETLSYSVQFIMSNSFAPSAYCDGGLASYAFNSMVAQPSIELTQNMPYDPDKYYDLWATQTPIPLASGHPAPFRPFQTFERDGEQIAAVKLFDEKATKQFDEAAIARVKNYLAHGIPVASTVYIGANAPLFHEFKGGFVLDVPCPVKLLDHSVTIVGYGAKGGVPVWLYRNSYGEEWGDGGYFMVPIGANSFCSELWAYAALPVGVRRSPVVGDQRLRGRGGFDFDYEPAKSRVGAWTYLSVSIAAACLFGVAYLLKRVKRRKYVSALNRDETGILMRRVSQF